MNDIINISDDEILNSYDEIIKNNNYFVENDIVELINGYIFYIENNNFINYKKLEIDITNNTINKKNLISLIYNYNNLHSKKFDLTGIYKFEPIVDKNKIKDFCKNTNNYNFITKYDKIEDITFNPNVELFSDNCCIILFFSRNTKKEENEENKKKKKK